MKSTKKECNTHNLEVSREETKSVKSIVSDRRERNPREDENYQNTSENIEEEKPTDTQEVNDKKKYDKTRRIPILEIRKQYREDWESKEKKIRQRGVILYIFDKLALRPGIQVKNGKKSNTTGCCSLRKKHLTLHEKYGDHKSVVEFNFLGKSSIPYHKEFPVEKRVFENLQDFLVDKSDEDYVFEKINTPYLNTYLKTFMDGLTVRVFRTYHPCQIMQKQLTDLTCADDTKADKIQSFKKAINKVANYLNHKQAVIQKSTKQKKNLETKEENKEFKVETKTSKQYYIDPRIVIAWCKKWDVQIEKIYTKRQLTSFSWAMRAEADYEF